ncbi:hypothetical protein P691DRAFT_273070 [Macrolepiota fuliginosa MF-IS2]|uniref:Uncharacterized protein n=1 Tax=Macrolepiota fuliginosa MF-IS2 TaxID=1400762 RepID=A0A9P6C1A1_9AGAR|nr:hypothetical protein P691DRAFT_273070 [Macrolepiota fuliginosa MF-IS2]
MEWQVIRDISLPSPAPSDATILLPVLYPTWINQMEMRWAIEMVISGISYGILLALSLVCLRVLSRLPRSKGFWNQRNMLMIHVGLLLLLNTAVEVHGARVTLIAIFKTRPEALTHLYLGWPNIVNVVLFALTDGLLVWRCYMVQKAFTNGKFAGWQCICWIIPLIFWITFIGVGMATVITSKPMAPLPQRVDPLSDILLVTAASCNTLLNLFATTNIIVRLLSHRRAMIASFGRESSMSRFPLKIVGILLESVVINLPVSITIVVYTAVAYEIGFMVVQIAVLLQSCSSILVIYQVAMRRVLTSELASSNKKENTSHCLDIATLPGATQTSSYDS